MHHGNRCYLHKPMRWFQKLFTRQGGITLDWKAKVDANHADVVYILVASFASGFMSCLLLLKLSGVNI